MMIHDSCFISKGGITMIEDNRKERVIIEATRIIAEKGYENAKITDIADAAGVASGLIYSRNFFINKLDLLLSIALNFWVTLNEKIDERINADTNPRKKMDQIINTFNELLIEEDDGIYLAKVLHESLPLIYFIKEDELVDKREQITKENRKILSKIDTTIKEGQKKGIFDDTLSASILRQVLYGSFEFLLYGIFLNVSGREDKIGYEKDDILKVMKKLVEKFLMKN
jgi:TetR/AcrR family fatty acid metabolism transcriptional regulator